MNKTFTQKMLWEFHMLAIYKINRINLSVSIICTELKIPTTPLVFHPIHVVSTNFSYQSIKHKKSSRHFVKNKN